VAIKVISQVTRQHEEMLRQQLAAVKRMDLGRLPIARPVAMLASPHVGYVMELITGMRALSTLFIPPRKTPSIRDWYIETGGMRRRLRVLAHFASILSQIHGKGLVYGDPSPGNVLVSATTDSDQVFLIDSDNLRTTSNPTDAFLFTPGYGAPELLESRSGINSLTDAHAFAVIAFQVLTLCHPLIGDQVADGDPALEEAALRGNIPWIEHPTNEENRCSFGIPRNIVLSPKMTSLCETTFQDGLRQPTMRPGVGEWAEVLSTAAAVAIVCPKCGWSYFYSAKRCPICGESRPDCLIARIGVWNPSDDGTGELCVGPNREPLIVGVSVGTEGHPLTISPWQIRCSGTDLAVSLTASLEGGRIVLSSHSDEVMLHVAFKPGEIVRPVSMEGQAFRPTKPNASFYVHCGEVTTVHRVIRLSILPRGDK